MDTLTLQWSDIVRAALTCAALFGGYKLIMEAIHAITERHDREQKWDDAAKEREKITKEYDKRFDKIDDELYLITECLQGIFAGLHQLNCNGPVTEMAEKLNEHLNKKAHGQGDNK